MRRTRTAAPGPSLHRREKNAATAASTATSHFESGGCELARESKLRATAEVSFWGGRVERDRDCDELQAAWRCENASL